MSRLVEGQTVGPTSFDTLSLSKGQDEASGKLGMRLRAGAGQGRGQGSEQGLS